MAQSPRHDDYDAVVVGAGWAGLYMLHSLRKLGLDVILIEAGASVGGTWYWNRYPGARCDIPSLSYSYSFDSDLEQEWFWTERFAGQAEIQRYAEHVAERFRLWPFIRFETRVDTLTFDEAQRRWTVSTADGRNLGARYVLMATGGYSKPLVPDIPGINDFAGERYLTARWPQHRVEFAGKKITVIGTGASGMQTITAIGQAEFESLTVFQRTANFAVPSNNRPMTAEEENAIKADYATLRARARQSGSGTVYEGGVGSVADLSDEELTARLDAACAIGGVAVIAGISDLLISEKANNRVAEYFRSRIRSRVDDPKVAERLCPRGHFVGAKRVLVEDGYFDVFNKPNVTLVDLHESPIERIELGGIRTRNGFYETDMLLLATGFDSGTGALLDVDIRGIGGASLRDQWKNGPTTYLGLMVHGFPNLFIIAGPGSPGIRSNVLVSIEQHVEWLTALMSHLQRIDADEIASIASADEQWTEHVAIAADSTLLTRDLTQYIGANVPGKPRVYLSYVGGVAVYRRLCNAVADADYEGFAIARHGVLVAEPKPWRGTASIGGVKTRYGTVI